MAGDSTSSDANDGEPAGLGLATHGTLAQRLLWIAVWALACRVPAVWGQSAEGLDSPDADLGWSATQDSFPTLVPSMDRVDSSLLADSHPTLPASGWATPYGPYYGGVDANASGTTPGRRLFGPFRCAGLWVRGFVPAFLTPPTGRHRGIGGPLAYESWRYRPFSASWFMGMVEGSTLIDDWVGGKRGFFGGYRLGWDFDHYWGYEMRLGFGNVALCDSHRAKQAQQAADDDQGLAPDDPFRQRFNRRRDLTTTVWDVSLLYYPWGDATWRPYLLGGLGVAHIEFIDRLSTRYDESVFEMPLAVGVKYRCNERWVLRLELADNIGFGDRFNTVHHVSLTGGAELRFGGSRVAYWPWNPGLHYW